MPKLFGIDIAGLVANKIGPGLLDCTLHTYEWQDRDDTQPGLGRERVATDVDCKGVMSAYAEHDIDGTRVQEDDRQVLLIAKGLDSPPVTGEDVTVEGERFTIIRIKRDPAAATYILQVRQS